MFLYSAAKGNTSTHSGSVYEQHTRTSTQLYFATSKNPTNSLRTAERPIPLGLLLAVRTNTYYFDCSICETSERCISRSCGLAIDRYHRFLTELLFAVRTKFDRRLTGFHISHWKVHIWRPKRFFTCPSPHTRTPLCTVHMFRRSRGFRHH
jgi:hypothetical protein